MYIAQIKSAPLDVVLLISSLNFPPISRAAPGSPEVAPFRDSFCHILDARLLPEELVVADASMLWAEAVEELVLSS